MALMYVEAAETMRPAFDVGTVSILGNVGTPHRENFIRMLEARGLPIRFNLGSADELLALKGSVNEDSLGTVALLGALPVSQRSSGVDMTSRLSEILEIVGCEDNPVVHIPRNRHEVEEGLNAGYFFNFLLKSLPSFHLRMMVGARLVDSVTTRHAVL